MFKRFLGCLMVFLLCFSFALAEPATRIVALTASDCEILYALGVGERLVGRGPYCNYPVEIELVPVAQSNMEINYEEILALSPDLIILSAMDQKEEQAAALEAAGVKVVVTDVNSIEQMYLNMEKLGALVGKENEAGQLVAKMKESFAAITQSSENAGKTVYFEVSPLEWGLWTAGKNTFMDELAAICGLTNAFSDVEGWAAISQEQVLERDPDYIVTITGETLAQIALRPGWEGLTAVENGAVLGANSDELSIPGPRLQDGAEALNAFVVSKP